MQSLSLSHQRHKHRVDASGLAVVLGFAHCNLKDRDPVHTQGVCTQLESPPRRGHLLSSLPQDSLAYTNSHYSPARKEEAQTLTNNSSYQTGRKCEPGPPPGLAGPQETGSPLTVDEKDHEHSPQVGD